MDKGRRLAVVSAVQLLTQLAGLRIALRRQLPPNFVLVNGPRVTAHLSRTSILLGTARSAPGVMLGAQAAATASLLARPGPRARTTLGMLGLAMVLGHLVERNSPLWPGHRDPVSTPLYALGLAGSITMGALALRDGDRSRYVVVPGHTPGPTGAGLDARGSCRGGKSAEVRRDDPSWATR